jgi:hypothetical protein
MKKELVFCGFIIFQKESTLYGNSYYVKEEDRPYSFAQVSAQKIRETDTIEVDLQKVSVSAPNPPKLCLLICYKFVGSLIRLFPAFLCFEYRLWKHRREDGYRTESSSVQFVIRANPPFYGLDKKLSLTCSP